MLSSVQSHSAIGQPVLRRVQGSVDMPSSSLVELALLLNNIGVSRFEEKDYAEAKFHFNQARELTRRGAERISLTSLVGKEVMNKRVKTSESVVDVKTSQMCAAGEAKKIKTCSSSNPSLGVTASSSVAINSSVALKFNSFTEDLLVDDFSGISSSYIFQRSEYDEGMHVLRGGIALSEQDFSHHYNAIHEAPVESFASTECLHHALLLLTVTYNLGQVSHAQGECETALCHYRCSIRQLNLYIQQLMVFEKEMGFPQNTIYAKVFHRIPTHLTILRNVGYVYYERSQFLEAMSIFTEALEHAKKTCIKNEWDLAVTLNCIGVLQFHMPEPEANSAMQFYMAALEIQRSLATSMNERSVASILHSCMQSSPQDIARAKSIVEAAIATTLNNIGRVHYMNGEFEEAMKVYQEALYIRRLVLGDNSLDVAATIYNTGQTYHQLGELDEALMFYREFLRIASAIFGTKHRDIAIMLRCIAQIHHERSEYDKAAELYKDALACAKAVLGNSHPEIASTLNKVGNLYYEQGDLENAMNAYQEGLAIEREVLEENHPNISVTLSNIGQIYKQHGEYDKAIKYYKEALRIQKNRLGHCHPNVAVTLSSIGMIFYQLEDYDRAFDLYQDALCLRREAFGDENLDVSATLNSIGMVLFKKGHHEMAMEAFTKAYNIRKALLGEMHRDVAIILHNIATIHLQRGDDDTALTFYKKTLEIEKTALGDDHVDVSLTLHHIGQMYQGKGDVESAFNYFTMALKIEERRLGWNSVPVARSLNNLANMYLQMGCIEKAMNFFASSLRIYRELGQSDDSLVIVGLNLYTLGRVHPEASPAA